jgi:ATP-binding cassette subfamily B protein
MEVGTVQRWMRLLRLLGAAGGPVVTVALLLSLAFGLLPIAFIVAMSRLLSQVPAATATHGRTLGAAIGLTLATLVLQQLLGPFQTALADLISRRVDGHCMSRLLATSYRDASIATLERPGSLDGLADLRAAFDKTLASPGDAAAALPSLLARYAHLFGAVILLGTVLGPIIAFVVGATALVIRFGQRGSLGSFAELYNALAPNRRRLAYVRGLAMGTTVSKEIRVLGLSGWLGDRLRTEHRGYLDPLWTGRRQLLLWPFVGLASAGFVGGAITLAGLAQLASGGGLSLLDFAIAVQAVLIPIRFGAFFPEADTQTQFGGLAYETLLAFEARNPAPAPPPRATAAPANEMVSVFLDGHPLLLLATQDRHDPQQTVVSESPRGQGSPHSVPERVAPPGIRFDRVGFAYPGGHRVYTALDLDIPAGQSTAIVGLNGAGKTTLVKLLARLYDPDSGAVTVDGHDLRGIDAAEWQRRLAIIFQDFNRYELTAAENIGLDRHGETEAILRAAARAGAAEIIDRVGLRTPLSSRYRGGTDLSGGQWQRVALARAFFAVECGASVLVLDEPTAQLDVRAEVEFFDQFLARTQGLTSIVISHRFSTVRRADHIAVLADGLVVERGDHDSLVTLGGRYAEMFHLQAQRFALDTAAAGS